MTEKQFHAVMAANNHNQRTAIRTLSQEERLQTLITYFRLAEPIKNRCQDVTPREIMIIRVMCEAYNQFFTQQGGHFSRLKPSACQLPNNLAQVRRFLTMAGKI